MDTAAQDRMVNNVVIPSIADTLVTVLVTHYNYSHLVGRALQSVVQQTHQRFECVIVDDGSQAPHVKRLHDEVEILGDKRFRILALPKNMGQTAAVFEGLRKTSGDFVALLDPDDLYEPDFLAEMLRSHLNPCLYAAVAGCEMALYRVGGGRLTGTYSRFRRDAIENGTLPQVEASLLDFGFSKYLPPETHGWLWCTTSSLMFRRDALIPLQRKDYGPDLRICADTYCVFGAHLQGGTLFVDKVLSWRGIHADNAVETERLVSSEQRRHKPSFTDTSRAIKLLAAHTLVENGAFANIKEKTLARMLNAQFSKAELADLLKGHEKLISAFAVGNGT
jgi:Glycosyl transferase family 2